MRECPQLAEVPLSILWAVEDGTLLHIGDQTVHIPTGHMIIFRGDLCHGGAAYSHIHTRIHAYLDPHWMQDKGIIEACAA